MRKLPLMIPKLALAMQLAVLLPPPALVAEEILTLSPEETIGLLKKGQKIRLVLRSGTYAEAKVEDVKGLCLEVKVRRSDNLRDLFKGKQVLSLDRVASVSTWIYVGQKRKALPPLLAGVLAPTLLTMKLKERWPFPVALGITVGAGMLGYYGGRASDRQPLTIYVKHGCLGSVAECGRSPATAVGIKSRG